MWSADNDSAVKADGCVTGAGTDTINRPGRNLPADPHRHRRERRRKGRSRRYGAGLDRPHRDPAGAGRPGRRSGVPDGGCRRGDDRRALDRRRQRAERRRDPQLGGADRPQQLDLQQPRALRRWHVDRQRRRGDARQLDDLRQPGLRGRRRDRRRDGRHDQPVERDDRRQRRRRRRRRRRQRRRGRRGELRHRRRDQSAQHAAGARTRTTAARRPTASSSAARSSPRGGRWSATRSAATTAPGRATSPTATRASWR